MFDFSATGVQNVQERSLIRNVYLWMTAGLALTAVASFYMMSDLARLNTIMKSGTLFGLFIAEFILVFMLSGRILSMSPLTATLCFGAYSVLNGITLSPMLYLYTQASLTTTFFVTAATFGAMSLYAVTTKKNLAGMGQYLSMGLIGIIIASVVNMFLGSSSFDYMISFAGVLLFCGLTAFDVQYILNMSRSYSGAIDETDYVRFSILGALKLYLDFINMFIFLLRFFGRRND